MLAQHVQSLLLPVKILLSNDAGMIIKAEKIFINILQFIKAKPCKGAF